MLKGTLYAKQVEYLHNQIRIIIVGITVALSAGCAIQSPAPPIQMRNTFDPNEYYGYLDLGKGTIKGQAFLRQQGGGVVTCAGSDVYIMPSTPFFQEVLDILRVGRIPSIPANEPAGSPSWQSYYKLIVKKSQCNAQGNFSFSNVPAEKWLILTEVKWIVAGVQQGGSLLKEVNIKDGQTIETLLTEKEYIGR